ncbi:nucleotide-binding universal stress UspA family protein [Saccharothrix coeruleofusca]|uniref:universal stress protein n=1 Tax=Saccharothrix coeruleofusca TaxID=33919 RepID=UPI001AE3D3F9|nr:universal stress protein [Saccharothrix coeruleofusca]MBP2335709.1 nucleotide-binding universal stress UspA family protein [Saccharothrix coeruleofusca]
MIVVGVDGSPASRGALRWALDEATRTGASVEAVMAWSREPEPVPAASPGEHPRGDQPDRRHPARELHEIVEQVRARVPRAPEVVEVTIVGDAGRALTDASRQADLLVVGATGRGALVQALLGDVPATCLRHSACPVVVVPPRRT